ncbi:MAG: aldo/keto reductase [Dehalococcoidia bacterium]|nr:aldo/keto reductase [Dehalococcoidia bacterium]
MKYRRVASTEMEVGEVAFGVWTVSTGWWGKSTEQEGVRLLGKAFDLGINLFDTADTYGEGLGETIMAKAFPQSRHEIVIGTKFGYDFYTYQAREGHRERPQNFSPQFVRQACEQSLRRLNTDYIDLYQLHNPRLSVIQQDDLFELLERLVAEGKIRHYGAALGPDIGWFDEGAAAMQERHVPSLQVIYSLLEQDPARAFFPIAAGENTGLLARVPHASEVLTDKFTEAPSFAPGDHRALRRAQWLAQAIEKRKALLFLAQGTGRTLAQAAIKFSLAQPTIVAVLPNITNEQELMEYAAAPETPNLTQEELARIEDLYKNNFYLDYEPGQESEGAEVRE